MDLPSYMNKNKRLSRRSNYSKISQFKYSLKLAICFDSLQSLKIDISLKTININQITTAMYSAQ